MDKNEKPQAQETAKEPEAIKPGVPVRIEAATRDEAAEKVREMRKRAAEQELSEEPGGMIHKVKKDFLDPGIFVAELTFNEKQ